MAESRTVLGKVRATPPVKQPNKVKRTREYLTEAEVDRLLKAAKYGRTGHRNYTLILLAYRHGLRRQEICDLQWSQIDLDAARIHVKRIKNGENSVHPLYRTELLALRKLKAENTASPYVFNSELRAPLTERNVGKIIEAAGKRANFPYQISPHMLRHSCGYYLANKGVDTRAIQAYLGHKNIQHTCTYTALAVDRFNNLWGD